MQSINNVAKQENMKEVPIATSVVSYHRTMAHKEAVTTLLELKNKDILSGSLDTEVKMWSIKSG